MAVYIDRDECGDIENLSSAVLQFVTNELTIARKRLDKLDAAYMGKNAKPKTEEDEYVVVADYPRYIVDTFVGYYLGDPIKYIVDDTMDDAFDSKKVMITNDGDIKIVGKETKLIPPADIKPVLNAYRYQTISEKDTEIGRQMGVYGETYELVYANEGSRPMSCVCDPRFSVMVRDTSVNHNKLFFLRFDKRKNLSGIYYYIAYVYTDKTITTYRTSTIDSFDFAMVDKEAHYFGEVPVVEYNNNSVKLGDFETQMLLIEAYNDLLSDRVTDKRRFIDSVLAMFGSDLSDEMIQGLDQYGIIAGLPNDARLEYLHKVFDESSVQVLAKCLSDEILRQSKMVDLSDATFTNSSGLALKLRLLSMSMTVKNKIRSMEGSIRKRFELYNKYLHIQGLMGIVNRDDINPIFSLALPVDEQSIAQTVKTLEGVVPQEELLSLLWFIKDPKAAANKVNEEKKNAEERYLDVFGITANRKENIGTDAENTEEETKDRNQDNSVGGWTA